MRTLCSIAAGFLLFSLLAGGCAHVSPFRAIEQSVRAELPRLIGPADRYEVTVSRSSSGLIAGRIPWIEIRGQNVRAIRGLNLDELEVRLEGVRFNRSDRSVREIEQSRFQAQIGSASIVTFLHSRQPDLQGVWVRVARGEIAVHATPQLLGIGFPIEVSGRPILRSPTAIDFEASRFSVLSLGLPPFVVRRLEARINPLVDLDNLSFPARLTAVGIEGDRVVVAGTTVIVPARLRPRR